MLHRTSTVVKMAFSDQLLSITKTTFLIFAGSEMRLHDLHKASTVVKMVLSDNPSI